MIVETLALVHFRSYRKAQFSFSPDITLIVGPNASGKTNILEALYVLATGRSLRAQKEAELITLDCDVARVKGVAQDTLELVVTPGLVQGKRTPIKKYLVNGVTRRAVDFVGKMHAVLFWPQDIELITDSPSLRRKYLDSVLVQVDREYRRTLTSYERGLRQRNRVLEAINEGMANRGQLVFWDQLLIKTGNYITTQREEFLAYVNTYAQIPSKRSEPLKFQVVYDKSTISPLRLEQYKEAEVAAKATLVGPHRDDFRIEKSLLNLHTFGSRGEQRLGVLWLKLAELSFITQKVGDRPLLLLDDIFSELDEEHRNEVLSLVTKQQTILTSAEADVVQWLTSASDRTVHVIRLPQ